MSGGRPSLLSAIDAARMAGVEQHQHLADLARPGQRLLEVVHRDAGIGNGLCVNELDIVGQQKIPPVGGGAVAGEPDHQDVALLLLYAVANAGRASSTSRRLAWSVAVGSTAIGLWR
jgi:hypothetical protein